MKVGFIDSVHPLLWEELTKHNFECLDYTKVRGQKLLDALPLFDGVVIRSKIQLFKKELDLAKNLKFIARSGSGLENIDLEYAQKLEVKVYNSPEGNCDAVGEHVIMLILSLFNHLRRADQEVRNGIWLREENRGLELKGKTVGIIGYGVMGQSLAKKLSGFDCKVIAYDKYKTNYGNEYAEEVSLDQLYQESDVVSLHVNLLPENHYLINKEYLSKFKKPIYFINSARGQSVNISDLLDKIDEGKVLGAGLDVFEFEKFSFEQINEEDIPSSFKKLIKSNKVVLSPHIAGWTQESYIKLADFLAQKILNDFKP